MASTASTGLRGASGGGGSGSGGDGNRRPQGQPSGHGDDNDWEALSKSLRGNKASCTTPHDAYSEADIVQVEATWDLTTLQRIFDALNKKPSRSKAAAHLAEFTKGDDRYRLRHELDFYPQGRQAYAFEKHRNYLGAAMIQACEGRIVRNGNDACQSCRDGRGRFQLCVRGLEGQFNGACTNCALTGHTENCSFTARFGGEPASTSVLASRLLSGSLYSPSVSTTPMPSSSSFVPTMPSSLSLPPVTSPPSRARGPTTGHTRITSISSSSSIGSVGDVEALRQTGRHLTVPMPQDADPRTNSGIDTIMQTLDRYRDTLDRTRRRVNQGRIPRVGMPSIDQDRAGGRGGERGGEEGEEEEYEQRRSRNDSQRRSNRDGKRRQ